MSKAFLSNAVILWEEIGPSRAGSSYSIQADHYKNLFRFLQIGDFYSFVFDFTNTEIELMSPSIQQVKGFPTSFGVKDFMNNIHPDDHPYFLNFEHAAVQFLRNLPVEKMAKYKVQYDFRLKNSEGNYIRILHQSILINYDDQKNFYKTLVVHTNINHIKQTGKPSLSFIGIDGEPSYIDIKAPELFRAGNNPFTKRELEILRMIIEGYKTEQIAATLFISIHTVNTHRKNILSKSGAKSTIELISRSINNGWL